MIHSALTGCLLHMHRLCFPNPVLQADLISAAVRAGFQVCTATQTLLHSQLAESARRYQLPDVHIPDWLRMQDLVSLKPRTLCNKPARQVENHSEVSSLDFFPRNRLLPADNSGDILFYYKQVQPCL